MDSEKSMSSFEIEKDDLTDYLWNNPFFRNLSITFRYYYYVKYIFLASLIWLIFFKFLFYREVLEF